MDQKIKDTVPAEECRIRNFFSKKRTAAEECLLIGSAALAGAVISAALFSFSGGINIEISVGSHNGCHNTGNGCDNTSTKHAGRPSKK